MLAKRFMWAFVLTACLALPWLSLAGNADLTGSLEAFRVVMTDDGEELLPADNARPKDVIEYRLTYRNNGSDPVQNIFITDPIPWGTEYVNKSATDPAKGAVAFSVDGGKSYKSWPITIVRKNKDGEEKKITATPDMVTHIRWMITDTFKPESKITVSYRTTVK